MRNTFLWVFVVMGSLVGASQHQAFANASTYIANGNTVQVTGPTDWGTLCKQITNYSGRTIFVPANISPEWADFNANPGPGVTLSDCASYSAINPNYSACSAPCGGGTCTQNLVSWDCQRNDQSTGATSIVWQGYCSPPAATQTYTNYAACAVPQNGGCGTTSDQYVMPCPTCWYTNGDDGICMGNGPYTGVGAGAFSWWTCLGVNGGADAYCTRGAGTVQSN